MTASKGSLKSETAIAAANAMTILNAASVPFSGLDLSYIQIPGAHLAGGIFHCTNFQYSNLQNVNFKNAYLSGADFRNSKMKQTSFGIFPFLSGHSNEVVDMFYNDLKDVLVSWSEREVIE